ncbi:MAG: protoporphyrinogen oxidase HemJ [Myxococcales bacterium]|nr:protoporphyrinogen oxidase HemJ [Myxococcales bacterium]
MLWLKALHLIAMVAWFAGLFYMFRLFVNRVEQRDQPEVSAVLQGMAERLYRIITTPAMIATLVVGLSMLVLNPGYLTLTWIQIKLVLVAGLVGYHVYVGQVLRRFAAGDLYLTSRQCRIRNEIPTPFLVAIILLAVLRPSF